MLRGPSGRAGAGASSDAAAGVTGASVGGAPTAGTPTPAGSRSPRRPGHRWDRRLRPARRFASIRWAPSSSALPMTSRGPSKAGIRPASRAVVRADSSASSAASRSSASSASTATTSLSSAATAATAAEPPARHPRVQLHHDDLRHLVERRQEPLDAQLAFEADLDLGSDLLVLDLALRRRARQDGAVLVGHQPDLERPHGAPVGLLEIDHQAIRRRASHRRERDQRRLGTRRPAASPPRRRGIAVRTS